MAIFGKKKDQPTFERTDKESGVRPVDINSIRWIIFNGVKYIVK